MIHKEKELKNHCIKWLFYRQLVFSDFWYKICNLSPAPLNVLAKIFCQIADSQNKNVIPLQGRPHYKA